MDQRRGQWPFSHEQFPTRHQTRYADDRLYTQNYREFESTSYSLDHHDNAIGPRYYRDYTIDPGYYHEDTIDPGHYHEDTIDPGHYHDDTIVPSYYHDSYRESEYSEIFSQTTRSKVNTSTDHNINQLQDVGNTSQDRYPPYTAKNTGYAGNTGQSRYQHDFDKNTGLRYASNNDRKTDHSRLPPYTAGNSGHAGNTGYLRYRPPPSGNTGQNRNPPHFAGNTSQSKYSSSKNDCNSRDTNVMKNPLPHARAAICKPIPTVYGRYDRSPSKKWNNFNRSKKWNNFNRSPKSANKIITSLPLKPKEKHFNSQLVKKSVSSFESKSSQSVSDEKSELPETGLPDMVVSIKSQNTYKDTDFKHLTSCNITMADLELNSRQKGITSKCDMRKQPDLVPLEISPSCPSAVADTEKILPRQDVDLDKNENSLSETIPVEKLIVQKNSEQSSDSVTQNDEKEINEAKTQSLDSGTKNAEKEINEPETLNEIELIDRLESIELGTCVKGKDKQENLKNVETNVDIVNVEDKVRGRVITDEKIEKFHTAISMDPSCSRKDSINKETEQGILNHESQKKLSFTEEENFKKENEDKDTINKHNLLTEENKDTGENSKMCNRIGQDGAFERKTDSHMSVMDSVEPSKPELSLIGSDIRTGAKDRDKKELKGKDLKHRNVDEGCKRKPFDWKNKKIDDFHNRVLGKLSLKTSLVREVTNQSMEILKKKKDLNESGSSVELYKSDESMEVDENFEILTDTDAAIDTKSGIDTELTNTNYTDDLKCKNEEDQGCIKQMLVGENEICCADLSKENNMDIINVLKNKEQEVEADMDKEVISEYTENEGFNQVEGTDSGIMDVDSGVSMHFIENIELNGRGVGNNGSVCEVNSSGTTNTHDNKLQKSGDASVVFNDDGLGCLSTKKGFVAVELLFDNTNNVESTVEIQNNMIFDADIAKHSSNDNSNLILSKESGNVVELDITDISEHADETFRETENEIVDIDVNMKSKDIHVVCDAGNVAVDVGIDKLATFRKKHDSLDSALKQKYNIREVSVCLDKENYQGFETTPSDKQGDYTEGNSLAFKENKTEKDKGETTSSTEDISEINSNEGALQHKSMDTVSVEAESVTATQIHSVLKKGNSQEQNNEAFSGGWRKIVPLSERFSQLTNQPDETLNDSEETEYKAEFENIVNKLNKLDQNVGPKKSPHVLITSNTEQNEAMEVDEVAGNDNGKESKLTSVGNNDQVISKNNEKVDEKTDNMSPLQSMACEDVKGKKDVADTRKDVERNATSPVSFLDYSDESDDELLVTPSAFLRSIEEINGRPFVITPTKVIDTSQSSSATTSSNDLSPLKPVPIKPGVNNKFTLDGLLADHEERADVVKEMNEIDQELQDEIKQGGFVNILNKEEAVVPESPITDEQKELLRQFEVEESRICEDRPGVIVFEPQNYQCLFTSMLRPTDCGFTVGSNGLSLEKHLESLTPAQCKRVITSGIISQCFTKISCQTPIMRWLFFIMSIHDDYQVQQGCKKVLLEILHFQLMDGQQKWAPRLVDILSVLLNYGASLESLVPCNSSTLEIIRGKLIHQPGDIHQPVAQNVGMNTENLILVLQILAQCLHGPSGRYSPNDLSLLCVALCKASLDTSLKHLCAKGAFQNCVTMVIRQYLEADWLKERLKLTRMLVGITDHHHNNAHIAELLPPGVRGQFIQRGFCYLVLSEILLDKTNVSDELLNSINIKDLGKFIPKLKALLESDSYKLSSVVTLIDLCVGVHITLKSEEREQLKCLLEDVRRVRVRDNVSMLDRTRVKDMIVRMTSKWALDIQTMKGKQTKIFEYASPVKMHIEQVHELQSSGEEEDQSDSDDDRPCKLQKLSSQTIA